MKLISWQRTQSYAQRAGKEILALAEAVYLTLKDPLVPYRHKSLLVGSLIYLLSPIDGLPDMLPGGFTDDASILLAALLTVGKIGKDHLATTRQKHGLKKN